MKNKYEKSQYKAHTSSEPLNNLAIFWVGDRVLSATFDVMDQDVLLAASYKGSSLIKINITAWTYQPIFNESVVCYKKKLHW